jgi:hypothetical protein
LRQPGAAGGEIRDSPAKNCKLLTFRLFKQRDTLLHYAVSFDTHDFSRNNGGLPAGKTGSCV